MKLAYPTPDRMSSEFNETLIGAFEFGLADLFNIEWLIDKAEHGEWSGLWWQ